MPFNGPVIPFGAMVEYHPVSAKDTSRLHHFGPKVLPGELLGYALYAEGIWKGDIMVADIEELEEMDASELHARRLNAKEVLTPQRSGNFIFLVAAFVLVKERPPEGHTWSGWRLTRKQKLLVLTMYARYVEFYEPNDEEIKLTVKADRKKLEVPVPAAMLCKMPIKSSGETHRNTGKRKTKYACVVDADESTRPRLEGAGH